MAVVRKPKQKKPVSGIEGTIPAKTQAPQLDKRAAYLANNFIDLLVGFKSGVMIKPKRDRANKDDIYQNTFITIGIGLTGTHVTSKTPELQMDFLMRETYLKKYGAKKPGSKQLRKMLTLFKLLSKGKEVKGKQGYFHFRGPDAQEKAQKAAELFASYGFETKYEKGRNGFSITGLSKDLKTGYEAMRDGFLASVKERYIAWEEAGKEKKIDASELLAQEEKPKKKKLVDWALIDPRTLGTQEGADILETLLGRPYLPSYLEKANTRGSLISRNALFLRDELLKRKDIRQELEKRIQALQTKTANLSVESFSIYQRLLDTGLFTMGDAAFVARSCNKYQGIKAKNKGACGTVNLDRFNLEQKLAIVHTLGAIDKLPSGNQLARAFGRFNAHLDFHTSRLRVGNRPTVKPGSADKYAGYSKAGMERAFREWRQATFLYRETELSVNKKISAVRPIELGDMGHLYEAGGTISAKEFVYALSKMRMGEAVDYVAPTRAGMARFAAFVDKYYPGMRTAISRSVDRDYWNISVMRATEPLETGEQWAQKNMEPWAANRFAYGGRVASAIDNLGRETITITVPAGKNGAPGKPPAWFTRMASVGGRAGATVNKRFKIAMAQKGIDSKLTVSTKTRTEYYGRKKVQIPVSNTYTLVLDGRETRDALLAARTKVGLPKKKPPALRLKPILAFEEPDTAVATGTEPRAGDNLARLSRKAKLRRLGKKKPPKKKRG